MIYGDLVWSGLVIPDNIGRMLFTDDPQEDGLYHLGLGETIDHNSNLIVIIDQRKEVQAALNREDYQRFNTVFGNKANAQVYYDELKNRYTIVLANVMPTRMPYILRLFSDLEQATDGSLFVPAYPTPKAGGFSGAIHQNRTAFQII